MTVPPSESIEPEPPVLAPFEVRFILILYLLTMGFFFLYLFFDTWSGDFVVPSALFHLPDSFLSSKLFKSFMMATAGGGLGGVIYSILAFHRHVSVRQDFASAYVWGFFLSPWVAMVLGGVVFALVQGGLLVFAGGTPSTDSLADMGYFGFGFLGGFGWNSVTEKLRELVNELFGGSPDKLGLSPDIENALRQFAAWQREHGEELGSEISEQSPGARGEPDSSVDS